MRKRCDRLRAALRESLHPTDLMRPRGARPLQLHAVEAEVLDLLWRRFTPLLPIARQSAGRGASSDSSPAASSTPTATLARRRAAHALPGTCLLVMAIDCADQRHLRVARDRVRSSSRATKAVRE